LPSIIPSSVFEEVFESLLSSLLGWTFAVEPALELVLGLEENIYPPDNLMVLASFWTNWKIQSVRPEVSVFSGKKGVVISPNGRV
jgi:hypothetical protein